MARLRRIGPDGRAGDGAREIGGGLLLGRSADCDVVLADDQVSRHHARVVPDEDPVGAPEVLDRVVQAVGDNPRVVRGHLVVVQHDVAVGGARAARARFRPSARRHDCAVNRALPP